MHTSSHIYIPHVPSRGECHGPHHPFSNHTLILTDSTVISHSHVLTSNDPQQKHDLPSIDACISHSANVQSLVRIIIKQFKATNKPILSIYPFVNPLSTHFPINEHGHMGCQWDIGTLPCSPQSMTIRTMQLGIYLPCLTTKGWSRTKSLTDAYLSHFANKKCNVVWCKQPVTH